MVREREQQLLDYLYEVGQQVKDYMRDNGYYEFDANSVSIDVRTDSESSRYDKVTVWYFTRNNGEERRGVKKEFMYYGQKPEYKEVQVTI